MSRASIVSLGVLTVLAGLGLSGCSQTAALAPVGGNDVTEVRFATIDLLLANDVDVLDAPVCAAGAGSAIGCHGTTVEGDEITASATSAANTTLTVMVGSRTIYSGSLLAALDTAVRPTP
jgi:hypothetical protein